MIETIKPPIFIGSNSDDTKVKSWFFYAIKDGFGRFLKYVSYPFWTNSEGLPSLLDIKTVPPIEVMEEVELFLQGKVIFNELPRKQGRRNRIIRTLVSDDRGGTSGDQPDRSVGSGLPAASVPRVVPGNGSSGSNVTPAPKGRRRKLVGSVVLSGNGQGTVSKPVIVTNIPVVPAHQSEPSEPGRKINNHQDTHIGAKRGNKGMGKPEKRKTVSNKVKEK